jgi:hypothetical protein
MKKPKQFDLDGKCNDKSGEGNMWYDVLLEQKAQEKEGGAGYEKKCSTLRGKEGTISVHHARNNPALTYTLL